MGESGGFVFGFFLIVATFGLVLPRLIIPPAAGSPPEHNKPYNEQVRLLAGVFSTLGVAFIGFGVIQPAIRSWSDIGVGNLFWIACGLALVCLGLFVLRSMRPEK
jgi:hypothetical protein